MHLVRKIITALLLFTISIIKAQTIVSDRPDQTESSSIVAYKNLQLEAGVLFQNSDGDKHNLHPTILLRYGISKTFELRLVTQYESNKRNFNSQRIGGLSDLEIGAKIQLFNNKNVNTEVAFLSHLIIPTAKNEITNNKVGTINKLAISHSILEKVSVGYNIGYDYFGNKNGNLTYSVALGVLLSDKIGFYIEPYGEFTEFENHIASFDTGFTYLIKNNLQFDISYGTGLNYGMNYFSTGFSWNISQL